MIEYAFDTSVKGLTLDHLNAEYMAQHQAEASMLTTIAFANAAGAVINRWMFGRALAPDEMYDPKSRLDSIDRDGWSIKGSPSYVEAPETARTLGEKSGGTTGLPKTTKESVDTKLSTYLLDSNHPSGGSKAKWFKEALGFTKENSGDLGQQIVFDPNKATTTLTNTYGTKYSQIISIRGANGRIIEVEFIWIRNNDGVVRLVTSIPTKK